MWPKRKPSPDDIEAWQNILDQAPEDLVKSMCGRIVAKKREYTIEPVADPKLAKIREANRKKAARYRARKKKAARETRKNSPR